MSKIYLIQRRYFDYEECEHSEAMDVAFTSLKAAQDYINKLEHKEDYFIDDDVELIGEIDNDGKGD